MNIVDFASSDIAVPLTIIVLAIVAVVAAQWFLLKTISNKLRIKADSWLLPSAKNDFDSEWDKPPPKPLSD